MPRPRPLPEDQPADSQGQDFPYLLAGGTALRAFSNIFGGFSERSAANYNAKAQRIGAGLAIRRSAAEEAMFRRNLAKTLGQQRVDMAKSGLALTGTMRDLAEQSRAEGELDALKIRYAGRVEATHLRNAARLEKSRGSNAFLAGLMGAGNEILSGLSSWETQRRRLEEIDKGNY